jgi:hypothetical protein
MLLNSPLGTIFDVTHKADVYGAGRSYNIFAGKDASRGLGMSSLEPQNAVADYSDLNETDMKVLNDWYSFFTCVELTGFSCTSLMILFVRNTGRDTISLERSSILPPVLKYPSAVQFFFVSLFSPDNNRKLKMYIIGLSIVILCMSKVIHESAIAMS